MTNLYLESAFLSNLWRQQLAHDFVRGIVITFCDEKLDWASIDRLEKQNINDKNSCQVNLASFDDTKACKASFSDNNQSDDSTYFGSSTLFNSNLAAREVLYLNAVTPKSVTQKLLGNTYETVVFDASQTFDVNLFTLACGCIRGGGLLIIQLPNPFKPVIRKLKESSTHTKADIEQSLADLKCAVLLKRFFLTIYDQWITSYCLDSVTFQLSPSPSQKKLYNSDHVNEGYNLAAIEHQKILIGKIVRVYEGHARRPLVILAPRGRGKSASLALAAAKIIREHQRAETEQPDILVTAPSKSNLTTFYSVLQNLISPDELKGRVLFIPPDEILNDPPRAKILFIDEAAAIPVQLLQSLIKQYNRIVFATTSDGYEGNGRGFEVRFKNHLLNQFPQARFAYLSEPFRWSTKDILEASINRAFCMNLYEEVSIPVQQFNSLNVIDSTNVSVERISKKTLIQNNNLLQTIFGMLVNAHYQTRPSDLERILSDPSWQIFSLSIDGRIIGVILIAKEGNLSDAHISQCLLGKRFSKGHLLPQSIIQNFSKNEYGKYAYIRVVRIAVDATLRQKGFGSHLIQSIIRYYKKRRFDFLGTSFALDETNINFWLHNQLSPIRIGSSKDSSSGNNSCEMILPLTDDPKIHSALHSLQKQFTQRLLYQLARRHQNLPPKQSFSLLKSALKCQENNYQLSAQDVELLKRFSADCIGLSEVEWLICELYKNCLGSELILHFNAERDEIMIRYFINGYNLDSCIRQLGLTGKRMFIKTLRLQTKTLIERYLTHSI